MSKFCKKCGALIVPRKEAGKVVLQCPACKETQDSDGSYMFTASHKNNSQESIVIIDEDIQNQAESTFEAECPKCKHRKAKQWQVQTRSADEASTVFYRCLKCQHTWRDYGG